MTNPFTETDANLPALHKLHLFIPEFSPIYRDQMTFNLSPVCLETRLHMVIHGFVFEIYKTG